jgi:hypothetical protein
VASDGRPISWRLRAFFGLAIALLASGLLVTVRAVARRPDSRTLTVLESLQERARLVWIQSKGMPGFSETLGIRQLTEPVRWDDHWRLDLSNDESPEGVVRDRWGKAVRLQVPGRVHFRGYDLWSCGPNRTDDKGKGDDILIGEDLETEAEYTKRLLGAVAARVRKAKPIAAADDAREPTGLGALARELRRQRIGGSHVIEFVCERTRQAVAGYDTEFYIGSVEWIEAGDAWNHLVRYRCPGPVHRNGWDLYSLGPNGIDDRGGGDDILVGEDVAPVVSGR